MKTDGKVAGIAVPRKNNLDHIRLAMAVLVMLTHARAIFEAPYAQFPFSQGAFAVDTFFMLSGLLITFSYVTQMSLVKYVIARLFRIYPIYLVVVIVQYVIMVLMSVDAVGAQESLRYFISHLLFLNFLQPAVGQVFFHGDATAQFINGSLWTLKVEVAFYVLLPIIYFGYKRLGLGLLLALMFASITFNILLNDVGFATIAKQFPGKLSYFIIGMLCCIYFNELKSVADRNSWLMIFAIGYGAVIAFGWSFAEPSPIILQFVRTILYSGLIFYMIIRVGFSTVTLPPLRDLSYGIFLWHFPVAQTLLWLDGFGGHFGLFLTSVAAVTFVLAYASAVLIEEPCIRLGRTLGRYTVTRYDRLRATAIARG